MRVVMQHPTYGEIVYFESAWTGRRSIRVNGVQARALSKKEFMINGERARVKGSLLTGVSLCIGDACITLTPKFKWYESALAFIPFFFVMVWGNVPALCAIFPVVGGAIGGAITGAIGILSLFLMKKANAPVVKALIGLAMAAAGILSCFLVALMLLSMLV